MHPAPPKIDCHPERSEGSAVAFHPPMPQSRPHSIAPLSVQTYPQKARQSTLKTRIFCLFLYIKHTDYRAVPDDLVKTVLPVSNEIAVSGPKGIFDASWQSFSAQ